MATDKQKIIVITRRYHELHTISKGLGVENGERTFFYEEHTIDKPDNSLFLFWTKKLYKIKSDDLKELDDLPFIEELFKRLNDNHENTEYYIPDIKKRLTRIYELKKQSADKQTTHIYIYHHWLDKQGLGLLDNDNHFLTALKKDILQIESKNEEDCEFNWLIHDSDLLSSHYDGILQFREKIYHPGGNSINIPTELSHDNIWCFIHESSSKYYDTFIKKVFDKPDSSKKLESAEDFYKQLAFDPEGCKRRMKLLRLYGIDNYNVDINTLIFILQKMPFADFKLPIKIGELKEKLEITESEIEVKQETISQSNENLENLKNKVKLYFYLAAGKEKENDKWENFLLECVDLKMFINIFSKYLAKIDDYYTKENPLTIIFADEIVSYPYSGSFADVLNLKFGEDKAENRMKPILILTHSEGKDTIKKEHSLFNNSNIWIQTLYTDKAFSKEEKERRYCELNFNKTLSYFSECEKLGLYKQESAKEYIDYHLRIQKENYIGGDHKYYVIPNRYSSEDDKIKKKDYPVSNISLRILLVDDKLGNSDNTKFTACNNVCQCKRQDSCKLRIIKKLLGENGLYQNEDVFWRRDNIQTFFCPPNNDEWEKELNKEENGDFVSIIGVKDIATAKKVLSSEKVKLDLILLDYLLGEKQGEKQEDNKNGREYGIDLFPFIDAIKLEGSKTKSNAGLENRFWIFPITAFDNSFLSHLRSEGISQINYNWYIYSPTNPIISPKRFIKNLNEFIGLMVKKAMYSEEKLMQFFRKTLDYFESKDEYKYDDFIAFMGSEYSRFIHLYGNRLNILRDKEKSLFAKSIWDAFYDKKRKKEVKYENIELIKFNEDLQYFYYLAANCTKDQLSINKLRKSLQKVKAHFDLNLSFNEKEIEQYKNLYNTIDKLCIKN